MGIKLSIIVPAYNEEKRLGKMLDAYLPFFATHLGDTFELIVVVNGSTDGTAALASHYAERWPAQMRVIVEQAAIGKGGAVMLGLRSAVGVFAGYVDADGSTPPSAFLDLVQHVSEDDPVVIASRWCKGAVVSPPQTLLRQFASRIFNWVTRCLFGLRLHDTQCGAKVFHRRALDRILSRPGIITRWAFDVDLLYQVQREGMTILEIPTRWHDVEGSKLIVTETSLEMLAALARLRLMYSPLRWTVGLYDRYLTSGKTTEEALRLGLIFGISGQVSNLLNLVFQALAAHILLRQSGAEAYGDLAAALSIAVILSAVFGDTDRHETTPTGGAKTLTACARRATDVWRMLPLPLLLAVAAFYAGPVATVLRMDRVLLVYLALGLGLLQAYFSIQTAMLTAMRNGRSAALLNGAHSSLRVMVAGVLLACGFGVEGALGGAMVGAAVGLTGAMLLTAKKTTRYQEPAGEWPVWKHWVEILPLAGFALLSGGDVLLVKMRYAPAEAGEYALAAMMARMVFYLPMPLMSSAFARATRATSSGDRRREWMIILFSVLIPAVFMVIFAEGITGLMTGGAPDATVSLLRRLIAAYTPLALISLLFHFYRSRRRLAVSSLTLTTGGAAFALMVLLPSAMSRDHVVFALGAVNVLCLLVLAGFLWRRKTV